MYMGAGATMIRDTHADGLFERAELYLKRYAAEHRHYLHHQWEDEKKKEIQSQERTKWNLLYIDQTWRRPSSLSSAIRDEQEVWA